MAAYAGSSGTDYLIVALVGGLLGVSELLTRYRDEPAKAVINPAAALYVLINVSASSLALALLNIFKVDFGSAGDPAKLRVLLVLCGGLGAMLFFRSSLFVFKVGDRDVPLGPGLVLQILLDITDRAVDRSRANPRAIAITEIMREIDYAKARVALPAFCFGLMQNVSDEEQSAIGRQITALNATTIPPHVLSYLLGLMLMNIVGERVLRAAIAALREDIV